MRKILFWILAAWVTLFSAQTQAATEKSLNFSFTDGEPCSSISIGFSVAANHTVYGNKGGRVNENTFGKVGECHFDKDGHFYSITGALTNSQWGPTLLHGYGVQFRTPQVWRLSGSVGFEGSAVYYEQGCPGNGPYKGLCEDRSRTRVLPVPMMKVAVNMELGSARQMFAPFMTHEDAVRLPNYMQQPLGEITIAVRWVGAWMKIDNERIKLTTVTWTKRF